MKAQVMALPEEAQAKYKKGHGDHDDHEEEMHEDHDDMLIAFLQKNTGYFTI